MTRAKTFNNFTKNLNIQNNFSVTVSKRFYPMYGITLYELLNIDNDNKIFVLYNYLLNLVNKVLFKIKFYRILNFFLIPFENYIGGLLIVIAERKNDS